MSTLTAVRVQENITEAKPTTASQSVARVITNLTERKRYILSNISAALAHDIELTRRAEKKHPHPSPAEKPSSLNPQRQPAFETPRHPDYCTYRPRLPSLYHPPSPSGRPCSCPTPHSPLRPHQWRSTTAEEQERDPSLPNGGRAKVKFADDPVSEVRVFERWYRDEYVFGDGYWAKGPVRVTGDWCSVEDDGVEVGCAEAGGGGGEGGEEDGDGDEDGDEVMGEIGIEEIGRGGDGGPLVRMG